MAIHHPTPPLGGGERPRLPSAQVGPVTQAIRAMRAAEPLPPANAALEAIREGVIHYFIADGADRQRVRDLRRRIADRIEADLALLDALDGHTDLEAENEHGGDIQDEPHDEEPDREPDAEGEPSLGSLGGTAAGSHDSQEIWGNGDKSDREISPPSASHQRELMHREPGQALTEAREQVRRIRDHQHVRVIAGPDGRQYHCIALRMS